MTAEHRPKPPPDPRALGVFPGARMPPSDLDAEGVVLAHGILEEGDLDRVIATGLRAEHFYSGANQRIFEAMLSVHRAAGLFVDISTVTGELRDQGRLDQVGGTPYIAEICGHTATDARPGHLEQLARRLIALWTARQVQSSGHVMIAELYEPQGEARDAIIDRHERLLFELRSATREKTYESAGALAFGALGALADALRDGRKILGHTTGFSDLDQKTTGFHPGTLTVCAARPGMGKTAFACSMILRMTKPPPEESGELPDAVYVHSCEMPREEIALRLVCALANVELQKLRLSLLTNQDWSALFKAAQDLMRRAIFVDDKSAVTVEEVRNNIRRIRREIELGTIKAKKLALTAVDYLQLMRGSTKTRSREEEVAMIARDMKNLSKTEALPILALAQLNRNTEKKVDKRPGLADLRESGAIEQDADNIWFLYREAYYNADANDEAEVIIAKQRNGPLCTVLTTYEGRTTTFHPLAKGYEEFDDFGEDGRHPPPDPEEHDPYWNK